MLPGGGETVGATAVVASFTVIPFNVGLAEVFAVGASTMRIGDDESDPKELTG
jgi:hypothetical protein